MNLPELYFTPLPPDEDAVDYFRSLTDRGRPNFIGNFMLVPTVHRETSMTQQMIPEVGDIFLATEIGGETDGPFKRVEVEEPEPGVVYGVQWGRKGVTAFGVKDYVFMDAPGTDDTAF